MDAAQRGCQFDQHGMLARLDEFVARSRAAYETYEFHVVHRLLVEFVTVDVSQFYSDVTKDRLYSDAVDSPARRSAQAVLYECLRAIATLVAPITCFTAEDIWAHMPKRKGDPDSVHLALFPSAGTPEGPWLRTGDSGFISEGELFIIGRFKDLLIVYGRNHSPDDIETTIQEITRGRCAAIAVPDDGGEKLVAIIELKKRGDSDGEAMRRLGVVKREVTSAISTSHGLSVSDLVLVSPGSIPITTSGKVRRAECVQLYRQDEFTRLDA